MVQEVGPAVDLIFSIAAHPSHQITAETLTFTMTGEAVSAREIINLDGSRLHRVTPDAGLLEIEYQASIERPATQEHITEAGLMQYQRPSRYAESDILFRQARALFTGLHGSALLNAVAEFVNTTLTYSPADTTPTDSAVTTLATQRGVCRDFSHLTIAMLRAMDVPARYVACYAPGLVPMDFHAVTEAFVDGAWHVVDTTGLTDPSYLVRIASGRDAADCAFLTFHGGSARLKRLQIDAWVQEGETRIDPSPLVVDRTQLVRIT